VTNSIRHPAGTPRAHHVAVVGPRNADEQTCELAAEIGRLIAGRGAVVVCGGLGGVMDAAARGAGESGGTSVGLLPGRERGAAGPHLTIAIATGLGEMRNGLLVADSDAVIAVGCSWGTLSEIALAARRGIPVVSLGGWSVLDAAGVAVPGPVPAGSPAQAVELVFAALAS
jgi:uncharacterized protein (TIGR00725 family)